MLDETNCYRSLSMSGNGRTRARVLSACYTDCSSRHFSASACSLQPRGKGGRGRETDPGVIFSRALGIDAIDQPGNQFRAATFGYLVAGIFRLISPSREMKSPD